jgi:hypothetical protein
MIKEPGRTILYIVTAQIYTESLLVAIKGETYNTMDVNFKGCITDPSAS